MRIRIQTHKPLPDVKAWFVTDEHNIPETIYDLKEELCRRVQALKSAQYHGQNLVLLLDDFELLNDSPFGAVRDGDLICIKQISSPKAAVSDVEMQPPQGAQRAAWLSEYLAEVMRVLQWNPTNGNEKGPKRPVNMLPWLRNTYMQPL